MMTNEDYINRWHYCVKSIFDMSTNKPYILKTWVDHSVKTNNTKLLELVLNYLNVPNDDMSTKERLAYYQLMSKE